MTRKIVLVYSFLLVLLVVTGVSGIIGIRRVGAAWLNAKDKGLAMVARAGEFEINFLNSRYGENNFLLLYKTEGLEEAKDEYITKDFNRCVEEMKKALNDLKQIELKDEDRQGVERIERMEGLLSKYIANSRELIGLIEAGTKQGAVPESGLYEKMNVYRKEAILLTGEYKKLVEEGNRMATEDVRKACSIERLYNLLTVTFIILAIALGIITIMMVLRTINKANALLFNAVNQITSAGNVFFAAAEEQVTGARDQSSAVAETTSAAKELASTSEQVGDSIKRVSQAAAHALAGMAKIKEAIGKTNVMITSLGEKSQQIGNITELIDDVADQTNLLAVNASIEAARAGEQGRGFTVVADEIRKLADSTAKSTKDITSLIELIQHEMTNSIMSMETSVNSIDEEAKLAQQTAESAKEIAMTTSQQILGSKQIADAMINIDEAMKQIAVGAQQSQIAVKQLMDLAAELKKFTISLK